MFAVLDEQRLSIYDIRAYAEPVLRINHFSFDVSMFCDIVLMPPLASVLSELDFGAFLDDSGPLQSALQLTTRKIQNDSGRVVVFSPEYCLLLPTEAKGFKQDVHQ